MNFFQRFCLFIFSTSDYTNLILLFAAATLSKYRYQFCSPLFCLHTARGDKINMHSDGRIKIFFIVHWTLKFKSAKNAIWGQTSWNQIFLTKKKLILLQCVAVKLYCQNWNSSSIWLEWKTCFWPILNYWSFSSSSFCEKVQYYWGRHILY